MAKDKDEDAKGEGKDDAKAAKGGKMKLIIIIVVVVLALGGGGAFFMLKSSGGSSAPVAKPKPVPGKVVQLDVITINLAGGHFLKIGLALQATAAAGSEVVGAKALDAAIAIYSGQSITELTTTEGREKTKAELVDKVAELYENEVYDVYLTEYVMQ